MDNAASATGNEPFVQEVLDWLRSLAAEPGSLSVSEPGPQHFLLKTNQGTRLLLRLHPLAVQTDGDSLAVPVSEGIRSFTLWEDQWYTKKEIVRSRLRALLGLLQRIPGRVTTIRKIDRPATLCFLEENHLQASVLSKYRYGLFLPRRYFRVLKDPDLLLSNRDDPEELLVAVATFAHPRTFVRQGNPHRSYELVRFVSLRNTTVVGGLDKLLQHFIREHRPDDIMTYVDLEGSEGESYHKLGFEAQEDTPPHIFWVDPVSYERFYPHRLPGGVTEEKAAEAGFIKIHNAGSRKFVKTL